MRVVGQQEMERLFAVTDEIPLSREAVLVPLAREGEGAVRRLSDGRYEITLPEGDDLAPFLAALPQRLQDLG